VERITMSTAAQIDYIPWRGQARRPLEPRPRYPAAQAQLLSHDGNPNVVLGRVAAALRRAGVSNEEIGRFIAEATSGDIAHMLRTVLEWVTIN
jgi:hypothetical protein